MVRECVVLEDKEVALGAPVVLAVAMVASAVLLPKMAVLAVRVLKAKATLRRKKAESDHIYSTALE